MVSASGIGMCYTYMSSVQSTLLNIDVGVCLGTDIWNEWMFAVSKSAAV